MQDEDQEFQFTCKPVMAGIGLAVEAGFKDKLCISVSAANSKKEMGAEEQKLKSYGENINTLILFSSDHSQIIAFD